MMTPEMRAAVVQGLLELRAFWPALPDNAHTVQALGEELEGYSPEEIAAAFREVRSTHEHASAPKPWHIKRAAANAARRLRWKAPVMQDDGPLDFCPVCHTTDLYETAADRLHPAHRDGCPLQMRDDADELRLAEDRNAVWYGGRAPQRPQRILSVKAAVAAADPTERG